MWEEFKKFALRGNVVDLAIKKILKVELHIRSKLLHQSLDPVTTRSKDFPKRRITLSFRHHHLDRGLGFPDREPQSFRMLRRVDGQASDHYPLCRSTYHEPSVA